MRVLSVDLGTSNTVAVLAAHGRPPRVVEVDGSATMPSAVFAAEDGKLVVGRDAERRARLDPARFEPNPKRRIDEGSLLLGDVVVPVADALAAVLRRVVEETTRQLGGERLDEVRLTHPAQWGPVRRGVLLAAAHRVGGLGTLTLVPEPVAAAAHFASFPGQSLRPGQALAVYDLGAGTFDCAVVGAVGAAGAVGAVGAVGAGGAGAGVGRYAVLAEDGLPDLGGLDVDQALAEHLGRQVSGRNPARWQRLLRPETVADRRAQRALREDVRAAKEALSRHQQAEVPLPEPFADAMVTRGELEALIRPNLLRSVELLAAIVRRAGLAPHALAGIYLVGGSSRIPLVGTLIAERLRIVPTSLDQPETAVAFGAHHVSPDGADATAVRTGDLAPQRGPRHAAAPAARLAQPAYPSHSALPGQPLPSQPQPGQQQSGQQQSGQPAGQPLRSQPPPRQPPPAYPGSASPGFPAGPPPQGSRSRTVLLATLAVVLLVAAAVVAFVLVDGSAGGGVPSAQECQQHSDQDAEGFTRCLRQLAGAVAERNDCSPGAGGVALEQVAGLSVSCQLESADAGDASYQVVYTHGNALVSSQSVLDVWASATKNDRVEADWAGNGLRGRYVSTVDSGTGLLAFGVGDRPLYGMLVVTGDDSLTPDQLADYFEQHVQPGT